MLIKEREYQRGLFIDKLPLAFYVLQTVDLP